MSPLLVVPFVTLIAGPAAELPELERATGPWGGVREQLEARGYSFEGFVTADGSRVMWRRPHRGMSTVRALIELTATLDGEKAVGWKGGTIYVHAQSLLGWPGTRISNDVQVFDNIDAPQFVGLAEAWVQQTWFDGALRVKVGRIEQNVEFASVEQESVPLRVRSRRLFLNSSMGFSPTIARFGSYPYQSLGALIEGQPHDVLSLSAGAFDGALQPSVLSTLERPVSAPAFTSVFVIAEVSAGWTPASFERGRITAGGWGLLGREVPGPGTGGPYLIVAQTLWSESGAQEQGVGMFGQYGYSSPHASEIVHHAGGGVSWTGALPTRDDDAITLGATWVGLRRQGGWANETAVETSYRIALDEFLWLQPDLQYIVDPGGSEPDSLIATIRVAVDL